MHEVHRQLSRSRNLSSAPGPGEKHLDRNVPLGSNALQELRGTFVPSRQASFDRPPVSEPLPPPTRFHDSLRSRIIFLARIAEDVHKSETSWENMSFGQMKTAARRRPFQNSVLGERLSGCGRLRLVPCGRGRCPWRDE